MKIFVDSDVLLDAGLKREPFCQASSRLLDYLEVHPGTGLMAWHSIANIFYIFSKSVNKQEAKTFIIDLCQFMQIVATTNHDVLLAAALPMNDFEDALQCAAAMTGGAPVIVSRNTCDYSLCPIRTVSPEQILQELEI